ncbi:MAG: signal peptidase II [Firmicutes bacterium]|nr:signal peptidase II [Bacillota bacterium]
MKQKLLWFFKSFIWLSVLLLILDFVSKKVVEAAQSDFAVIPGFFYISYTTNTGAAWSMFENATWLLAIISAVAGIGMIVYFVLKFKTLRPWTRVALMMMIAGAWGNFIDRAFYPDGVIDFLSLHFGSYIFPTFNVADSCLSVGIVLLLLVSLLEEYYENKKKKTTEATK